jgi:flagellar basal-body rod modification protein FlgD
MSTVNAVASTYADLTAANAAGSAASSSEFSKSEFLTLLVAQLKNQDPMNPINNEQFLTQLATFSSLEQLISINTAVTRLAGGSK